MFQHISYDEVLSIICAMFFFSSSCFFEILKVKHLIGFCGIAATAVTTAVVVAVVRRSYVPFKLQLHGMVKL